MTAFCPKIDGWRTHRSQLLGDPALAPQASPAGAPYMASTANSGLSVHGHHTQPKWTWGSCGKLFWLIPTLLFFAWGPKGSWWWREVGFLQQWEDISYVFPKLRIWVEVTQERRRGKGNVRGQKVSWLKSELVTGYCWDSSSLCEGHSCELNYNMCWCCV